MRTDAAKGPQDAVPHGDAVQRLLVPVDATERSRWPLRYALAHRGTPVHVDLLFVAEPAARLEVLRFRTQAEMAEWQAKMAQWLLEDAAKKNSDHKDVAGVLLNIRARFKAKLAERQAAAKAKKK